MEYFFYGWEHADVVAVTDEYTGLRTPADLYEALSEIWCEYTCAPRLREGWSPENRTLGQCSVTAFLAQDIFGGKVYGILRDGGNYHCYNVVGDCVFDLTSEQFGDEVLNYEDNPEQFREVHFAKEEKRQRYVYLKEMLKMRFGRERRTDKREYAVELKHSGYNCCQAVLCSYADELKMPSELLKKMGACYGVGMGCMEATCGALCAAEMILGMKHYKGRPVLKSAAVLHERFRQMCGAAICKELKGRDTGVVLCECDDCVRNALTALAEQF